MGLAPFDPIHAGTVSSWARSAEEVVAWCSRRESTVPPQVVVDWSTEADVSAYVLVDDGTPVGYGETWVDDAEEEIELARLIVVPERRNEGLGRRMVLLLTELTLGRYPTVMVRVHPDNIAAVRCYAAAGFQRSSATDEEEWNRGQPVPYVWMQHRAAAPEA